MKYVKILGLAAVAAMALMAFIGAGTASATKLHKTGGTVNLGDTLFASLETGTSATLADTAGNPIETCTESKVHGTTTTTGGANETVRGNVSELTFSGGPGCNVTVHQAQNGTLEIHQIGATTNGTVTGSGFEVTIAVFGTTCVYGLGATKVDLGELTGSTTSNATMHIDAVVREQTGDKFLCPNDGRWIAKYEMTTPSPMWVEAS